MIPRRLRLSRKDFESVTSGKSLMRATSPHFAVSYGPGSPTGGCGVVVSKKVERSSVKRHLLKRRMREALRSHCAADRVLIVYARQGAQALTFADLSEELSALIERTQG